MQGNWEERCRDRCKGTGRRDATVDAKEGRRDAVVDAKELGGEMTGYMQI